MKGKPPLESSFEATVRKFIIENFLFGDDSSLKTDSSFLENGIIDSTGVLELITFLESTFGIMIADEEIVPENLDCIRNVVAFISRRLGESVAPMVSVK